jgi:DNA-binding Lrp family transcriptional regulator
MAEHEREMLKLIEGTPDPERHLDEFARQLGLSFDEAGRLIDRLEQQGRIRWEGERPVVVERG